MPLSTEASAAASNSWLERPLAPAQGQLPVITSSNAHQDLYHAVTSSYQAEQDQLGGPAQNDATDCDGSSARFISTANFGGKRKDHNVHERRNPRRLSLDRYSSRSPQEVLYGAPGDGVNVFAWSGSDHAPAQYRARSSTAMGRSQPRPDSSLTAAAPMYQDHPSGRSSTAVLPSNDQLLDSLPMANRLQSVLYSDGSTSRGIPSEESRSTRIRILREVLPSVEEATLLVGHFLEHTNTSLPILSSTALITKVDALYNGVEGFVSSEDVCLSFCE